MNDNKEMTLKQAEDALYKPSCEGCGQHNNVEGKCIDTFPGLESCDAHRITAAHIIIKAREQDALRMAELVIEGDESLASFTVMKPEDFESTKEALQVIKKYEEKK